MKDLKNVLQLTKVKKRLKCKIKTKKNKKKTIKNRKKKKEIIL